MNAGQGKCMHVDDPVVWQASLYRIFVRSPVHLPFPIPSFESATSYRFSSLDKCCPSERHNDMEQGSSSNRQDLIRNAVLFLNDPKVCCQSLRRRTSLPRCHDTPAEGQETRSFLLQGAPE